MMRATRLAATAVFAGLLAFIPVGLGASAVQAQAQVLRAATCTVPAPPGEDLTANADSSITVSLTASTTAACCDVTRRGCVI
jgi:hypothetical protein